MMISCESLKFFMIELSNYVRYDSSRSELHVCFCRYYNSYWGVHILGNASHLKWPLVVSFELLQILEITFYVCQIWQTCLSWKTGLLQISLITEYNMKNHTNFNTSCLSVCGIFYNRSTYKTKCQMLWNFFAWTYLCISFISSFIQKLKTLDVNVSIKAIHCYLLWVMPVFRSLQAMSIYGQLPNFLSHWMKH